MRIRQVRFQANGGAKAQSSFVNGPFVGQSHAQIVVSLRVVRPKFDALSKLLDGIPSMIAFEERQAEVVVSVRLIWHRLEYFPELADRLVKFSLIHQH